jgi:hypothetical protein
MPKRSFPSILFEARNDLAASKRPHSEFSKKVKESHRIEELDPLLKQKSSRGNKKFMERRDS